MANIAYPTTDHFNPDYFDLGLRSSVMVSTSSHNGSTQTIEMPGHVWVASMRWETGRPELHAEREAFWASVLGQVNRVQLWHIRRPTPRGTMQANTTFSGAQALGASTLVLVNATAGQTLLRGDMIGAPNNALYMVTADATSAAGIITVSVAPKLRAAISGGAAATLVRPSANFLLTQPEVRVAYEGYAGGSISVDLVEVFQ